MVTTPQRLSFVDVIKGLDLFAELKIPPVAVVENMAYFTCDHGTRCVPLVWQAWSLGKCGGGIRVVGR